MKKIYFKYAIVSLSVIAIISISYFASVNKNDSLEYYKTFNNAVYDVHTIEPKAHYSSAKMFYSSNDEIEYSFSFNETAKYIIMMRIKRTGIN